ncbi:hypothetical protein DIPPA_11107 [Diplonema papillatum]|nr:hypothetical protein DIPPA_11107 [Diplonema papillatum]
MLSVICCGGAGDVPCGEFQSVMRRKLGLLLEPPLLAVCLHFFPGGRRRLPPPKKPLKGEE